VRRRLEKMKAQLERRLAEDEYKIREMLDRGDAGQGVGAALTAAHARKQEALGTLQRWPLTTGALAALKSRVAGVDRMEQQLAARADPAEAARAREAELRAQEVGAALTAAHARAARNDAARAREAELRAQRLTQYLLRK
jgi:hypothetical protein